MLLTCVCVAIVRSVRSVCPEHMDAFPKARSPLTAVCCKPYIPHPGGNSKRPQDLTTGRASLSRRRPQGATSSRLWHVESSPFWLLPLTTIRVYRSWKTIAQPTRFSNESIFPDSLLGGFFLPLGFFNTGRPCSSPLGYCFPGAIDPDGG